MVVVIGSILIFNLVVLSILYYNFRQFSKRYRDESKQ